MIQTGARCKNKSFYKRDAGGNLTKSDGASAKVSQWPGESRWGMEQIVLWRVWRNYSFTNPSTLAQWNWFWIFNLDSSKGMSFYWCKTLSVWYLLGMWEDSNITCYHIGSKGNTEKLIWIFQIQFKYLLPRVGTSSDKFTQNSLEIFVIYMWAWKSKC